MVLELVGLSPAHAHDDRSRYALSNGKSPRSNYDLITPRTGVHNMTRHT